MKELIQTNSKALYFSFRVRIFNASPIMCKSERGFFFGSEFASFVRWSNNAPRVGAARSTSALKVCATSAGRGAGFLLHVRPLQERELRAK